MNANVSKTYRAYRCHELGDYQRLSIDELPAIEPAAGEVVIATRAFAIGFPEYLMIRGEYQLKPPLPFVPGMECSGEIIATGTEVSDFVVGQTVFGSTRIGAYAEQVAIKAENCLPLPSTFDHAAGASFLAAYKTAYVGLFERGALQAGETLLVHGAAGGVGLAAVELGKYLGATVIATGSSTEKLSVVKDKGADFVINLNDGGFRDQVKSLTSGRGADVIFDPVGGDVFDESMRCIATFGRLLVIGFAGGRIPKLAVNYALIKQVSIVGVRAGEYGRVDPVAGERVLQALLRLADEGQLQPHIYKRFDFEQLSAAFDELVERKVIGRAVVEIN
ncbi:MAG: NADPH:quinone oxidoreductase family protein [Pseudomonadota bacterium]